MPNPVPNDVKSYYATTGLTWPTAITDTDIQGAIDEAIEAFESETGWHPYIKTTDDVERTFDPPGAPHAQIGVWFSHGGHDTLKLDQGLMECTSIVAYSTLDNPNGTELISSSQAFLYPPNAAVDGLPYTQIKFSYPIRGARQSVKVTGKWGRRADWPKKQFDCIVKMAILHFRGQLFVQITGGVTSWSDADVKADYGSKPLAQWFDEWQKDVDESTSREKRMD